MCIVFGCTVRRVDFDGNQPNGPGTTTGSNDANNREGPAGAYPPAWPRQLPGLLARVFRYGNLQPNGSPPSSAELKQSLTSTINATPDYVFVDQVMGASGAINLQGNDTTPAGVFFSPDVNGPLSVVSDSLDTTAVDWMGFVHIPVAGSYDFNIILADDGASVYINGNGTPGSGTLLAQRNYLYFLQDTLSAVFPSPGDYPFELFWINQVYKAEQGGASIALSVTGPGTITFSSTDTSAVVIPSQLGFPGITLGNAQLLTIPDMPDATLYNTSNNSVFPWLPTEDATQMLTFFVDGKVARSVSPDLLRLATPSALSVTLAPGPSGTFDGDGIWLVNAIRKDDGTLVGLYHAENQTFTNGGTGVWSSSGIALSTDDGVSWSKLGQAVGVNPPNMGTTGGREIGCMVLMQNQMRWQGIGHGLGFVSDDPNAAPGTWRGFSGGLYNQTEPDPTGGNTEAILPGLSADMAECKLAYNNYVKQYILVWRTNGDKTLRLSASPDGTAWNEPVTLLNSGNANMFIEYGQLMGPSDVLHGQSTWLLYEQTPSTTGRSRDMVVRELMFQ